MHARLLLVLPLVFGCSHLEAEDDAEPTCTSTTKTDTEPTGTFVGLPPSDGGATDDGYRAPDPFDIIRFGSDRLELRNAMYLVRVPLPAVPGHYELAALGAHLCRRPFDPAPICDEAVLEGTLAVFPGVPRVVEIEVPPKDGLPANSTVYGHLRIEQRVHAETTCTTVSTGSSSGCRTPGPGPGQL